MVDITITPANVVAASGASLEEGTAGASILAGKVVYKDPATKKYLLADSNSPTVDARTPRGIALHAAELNQPLKILKSGDVTIGATLVAGTAYYLSDTPGGICPVADVGTGEYVSIIGLSKSTSVLTVNIQSSGVAL
jgi:hypothetical protein